MFKRKSRSDEPMFEEPSPGIKVYPPGVPAEQELPPARSREYTPGRGPLDSPRVIKTFSGRNRIDFEMLP